jgi:BolA protein
MGMQEAGGTTGRERRIRQALTQAFAPTELAVEDDSARHAGHAGARAGGETHYTVRLVSEHFRGRSRVECSRMVHQVLAAEFDSGLHALSLNLRSPHGPKS